MHDDDGVRDKRVQHESSTGEATGLGGPGGVQAARRAGVAALVVSHAWWAVSLPSFSGTATRPASGGRRPHVRCVGGAGKDAAHRT